MTEQELLNLIARARDEEWEELDLAGLDLEVLPPEIGSLVKLKRLILGRFDRELCNLGNKLTDLPAELELLENLEVLSAHDNQFTTIPKSIEKLTSLRELDLSNNKIAVIPEFIRQFTNLQYLDLGCNSIGFIPEFIE